MTTVRDIYNALFAFAPASMKMDWDNVGLLCGRFDAPVDTVLVALDPMPDVIDEAKKTGAQCIVTHHPLFFDAPRAVNDASYEGRCILELAEAKIAAINLHTNLDVCPGGVNDVLAEALGLTEVSVLNPTGTDARGRPYGLIRTGMVREQHQRQRDRTKNRAPDEHHDDRADHFEHHRQQPVQRARHGADDGFHVPGDPGNDVALPPFLLIRLVGRQRPCHGIVTQRFDDSA